MYADLIDRVTDGYKIKSTRRGVSNLANMNCNYCQMTMDGTCTYIKIGGMYYITLLSLK